MTVRGRVSPALMTRHSMVLTPEVLQNLIHLGLVKARFDHQDRAVADLVVLVPLDDAEDGLDVLRIEHGIDITHGISAYDWAGIVRDGQASDLPGR